MTSKFVDALQRYVVAGLGSGTGYFALTAYNREGRESGLSAALRATIHAPGAAVGVIVCPVGIAAGEAAEATWNTSEAAQRLSVPWTKHELFMVVFSLSSRRAILAR